jgi:hypothetical protein
MSKGLNGALSEESTVNWMIEGTTDERKEFEVIGETSLHNQT